MKKKLFKAFFAVAAIATVVMSSYKAYGSYTAANMSDEDLLMQENVEALASNGEGSGTGNTGPRQKYDCPFILTGDGFNCACTNEHECTPQEC